MAPVGPPMSYPSFVTGGRTAYVIPSVLPAMMTGMPAYTGYAPFYSLAMSSMPSSYLAVSC